MPGIDEARTLNVPFRGGTRVKYYDASNCDYLGYMMPQLSLWLTSMDFSSVKQMADRIDDQFLKSSTYMSWNWPSPLICPGISLVHLVLLQHFLRYS